MISSVDDVASGLSSSNQHQSYLKNLFASKTAGGFNSSWMAPGWPTAGVASPAYTNGSGYTCDKTTTGALAYTQAVNQNWLARTAAYASQPGTIILADRLWSCSGMGFAVGTYTVTSPGSLPPRIVDGGLNCEVWVENFVTVGAASGSMTLVYVDSASSTQTATLTSGLVSAASQGTLQNFPLVNNLGVRQITSLGNGSTFTSGTYGVTIMKRIAEIPVPAIGIGATLDWAGCALGKIPANACLQFIYLAQNTTAATIIGSLDIIDK